MPSDFRPRPRLRDPDIFRVLHAEGGTCGICGKSYGLELHHVLSRQAERGDDMRANLVFLCGDHHRRVTANDEAALIALGWYIRNHRWDVIDYVESKLGSEQAADWFQRRLHLSI